jgi:hypothetical protein
MRALRLVDIRRRFLDLQMLILQDASHKLRLYARQREVIASVQAFAVALTSRLAVPYGWL